MCSCVNVEFHAYQAQLFKSRPVTAPPSAFTDVPNVTPPVLSLSPFAVPEYYQEDNTNPPSARALSSRVSTGSSSDSDAGGSAATPARYVSKLTSTHASVFASTRSYTLMLRKIAVESSLSNLIRLHTLRRPGVATRRSVSDISQSANRRVDAHDNSAHPPVEYEAGRRRLQSQAHVTNFSRRRVIESDSDTSPIVRPVLCV